MRPEPVALQGEGANDGAVQGDSSRSGAALLNGRELTCLELEPASIWRVDAMLIWMPAILRSDFSLSLRAAALAEDRAPRAGFE
jgi:hypothetical protein